MNDQTFETELTGYELACKQSTDAIREFDTVKMAYRAQTIGDAEFIAGRKKYDAAMALFDTAFAKEAGWTD